MTEATDTCRHSRRLAARRPADRGPDSVVGQARTACRGRRHRSAGDGGDGLRLAVEGARAGRRRRTRRRTAQLSRHRILGVGGQPQRRQTRDRGGPAVDRVCGVGRRRAQPRQRRASTAEATAQIPEIVAIAHDSGVTRRGHRRHRVGLPLRRPDATATGPGHRGCGLRQRRRPPGDRRHHRHHHAAAGQRPGRPRSPPDRRHPARRAFPQHPRRRPGQRLRRGQPQVSPGSTHRSAVSAAARSRRAPAATSPPKTSFTCYGTAGFTSTSTCRPPSPPPASRRLPSDTTYRARCCAPATGFSTPEPCPSRR